MTRSSPTRSFLGGDNAPAETPSARLRLPEGSTEILDIYLLDARRSRLLDAEEEVVLAQAIESARKAEEQLASGKALSAEKTAALQTVVEQGDAARRQLVHSNIRLVINIAKRFRGRGLQFVDLIQEGNIGLMTAIEKYDYTMGNRFSTYATWWIRQSIQRAITNTGRLIRLPVHLDARLRKVYKTMEDVESEMRNRASIEQVAEEMELPPAEVRRLLRIGRHPDSLNRLVGDDEDAELEDFIEDTNTPEPSRTIDEELLQGEIAAALEQLTTREATVLRLRYGLSGREPMTLKEIGRHMGLSRERIRQIERDSLNKLRWLGQNSHLQQHVS